jgi:hypothetical protein
MLKGWPRGTFHKLETIDHVKLGRELLPPRAVVKGLCFINSGSGSALAPMRAARMVIPEFRTKRYERVWPPAKTEGVLII